MSIDLITRGRCQPNSEGGGISGERNIYNDLFLILTEFVLTLVMVHGFTTEGYVQNHDTLVPIDLHVLIY